MSSCRSRIEGWRTGALGDYVESIVEPLKPEQFNGTPYIALEHIKPQSGFLVSIGNSGDAKSTKSRFLAGDCLYGKLRPYLQKTALVDFEGVCSTDILVLRANSEKLDSRFLLATLLLPQFTQWAIATSNGTKMPRTSWKALAKYKTHFPPLNEQRKIASILSSVDRAIKKTREVIETTQLLKKELRRELFAKGLGHREFKTTQVGFIPKKWPLFSVSSVFRERKETSCDTERFPLHSLTIEEGITPKTDRYERRFLLKEKDTNQYKLVYPNDLVFNPMNLRFGAIARSKETAIVSVSAYYNVLELVRDECDIEFLAALLSSPRYIRYYDRIAMGSLIEKRRVHLSQFIKIKIPLPSLAEQARIARILGSIDKQIKLTKSELGVLEQLKQSLREKLLTGQIRIHS